MKHRDIKINAELFKIFKDVLDQVKEMQSQGQFKKRLNVYEKQVVMVRLILEAILRPQVFKLIQGRYDWRNNQTFEDLYQMKEHQDISFTSDEFNLFKWKLELVIIIITERIY